MFGRFARKRDPNKSPVTEERRIWIEGAFSWLLKTFDKEKTIHRKILVPHFSDFPIQFNGNEQTAFDVLKIVAEQMEVPLDEIHLEFYTQGVTEVGVTNPFGTGVYLGKEKDAKQSSGLYWGKDESDNKFHIWLENKNLHEPENLVATLAHEIAHIKLLGESKLEENDEHLTDLTTIVFGMGIFNANAAFRSFKNFHSSGWSKQGYLSQMDWGYGLALLAHIRGEQTPTWTEFLSTNVKGDFLQGEFFIANNEDLIWKA